MCARVGTSIRNVYAEVSVGACGSLPVSAGTGELARGVQLQKNGCLQIDVYFDD